MDIQLTAKTDVGLIRKNNEDNCAVCVDLANPDWEQQEIAEAVPVGSYGSLLVVADGMGGMNAGEVASEIAIRTVIDEFNTDALEKVVTNETAITPFLTAVIKKADMNILNYSKQDAATHGMGTTIVLAWILNSKAYIAWCGDSRCYLFNNRIGYSRLSNDHSYVQSLVDQGILDAEMAFDHPYSNIITRCLGDTENHAEPDFRIQQLRDGDIIMLCSDGLCGYCRDNQIADVVFDHAADIRECCDQLITVALQEGGYDNVTVAVAKVSIQEEEKDTENINNTLQPQKKPCGIRNSLLKRMHKLF